MNKITAVLFFLILLLSFLVRLYKIDAPLADWHSWRQADTASVTRNLLKDLDLLKPKYLDISDVQTGYFNPSGYRFVEFPVFNLLHAAIYANFPNLGFEVTGRLVSIFASLVTTFALFFIGIRVGGKLSGLLASFFYAILPYNIYFTRVILPDPLAVMFGVLSVLSFMRYSEKLKLKDLYLSSVFFSLGLLVKPHTAFYAIPILFVSLQNLGIKRTLDNVQHFLALWIAFMPLLLWRAWMGQREFFIGIPHMTWAYNGDGIRFRPSFWQWIFVERVGKLILGLWGLIPFGIGLYSKKSKPVLYAFLLGAFAYVSVFATANVRHDYYQLFIVPAIALTMGAGVSEMLSQKSLRAFAALIFSLGMLLGAGWFFIRDNYNINDPNIVIAGEAADKLLPKDALVIAPYNGNTAFLYQTKRSGWPVVTTSIDEIIELGAEYYVSTTLGDSDTVTFRRRFKVLDENEKYIIIRLEENSQ